MGGYYKHVSNTPIGFVQLNLNEEPAGSPLQTGHHISSKQPSTYLLVKLANFICQIDRLMTQSELETQWFLVFLWEGFHQMLTFSE